MPLHDRDPFDHPIAARELAIAELINQDASNAEIAAALDLSEGTLKTYSAHILKKLRIHYGVKHAHSRVSIAIWYERTYQPLKKKKTPTEENAA